MGAELKQTYTVRVPAEIAARLEEAARDHRITPTAFIQSLLIRKFKSGESSHRETDIAAEGAIAAKLETVRKSIEQVEQRARALFEELRFEAVKTRSALLHSLDQTLTADVVDKIIEASDNSAREYIAGINSDAESKS